MGKNIEELERNIIRGFPGLANDANFKITSPCDSVYNCIAWAYQYKDRWMWPKISGDVRLDGVCYWPDEVINSPEVDAFQKAFELKGYILCDNAEHEDGFQKIALYVKKSTTICTHAARELRSGMWTSKLGINHDIQHGTPYAIEGDIYGEVHCIMKRVFS